MNSRQFILGIPRRLASLILIVMMSHQLGACSCGCFEHNVWVQLMGISDHSSETLVPIASEGPAIISDADDHHCTGDPKPQYVDNARPLKVVRDLLEALLNVLSVAQGWQEMFWQTGLPAKFYPDTWASVHALSRPVLQVYRL